MPDKSKEHVLHFHCGICATRLTDAGALLTSCGHFFCASSSAACTRLRPGNAAGRCEQCGKDCDAGTLTDRGALYDQRVQDFVFSETAKSLRQMAEIMDFRDRHLDILRDNLKSHVSRIRTLKAEYKTQLQEATELRGENDALRGENDTLRAELARTRKQPAAAGPVNAPRPRVPSVELVNESEVHMGAAISARRREGHARGDPTRYSREANAPPKPRAKQSIRAPERYDPWAQRASASNARPARAAAPDPRGSKRRWMDQPTDSAHTGSRLRGFGTSSRATRVTGLSRFARGAPSVGVAASGASAAAGLAGRRSVGDWQRRVSTVPRPSATPDRLGRKPAKRARPGISPMGSRW